MRHLIAPRQSLAVAFGQRGEAPSGPERIAYITDGSLHATLLVAGAHLTAHLTRAGCKVIMRAQLDQAGIEQNLIAAPLQHGCLEIVVENHARLTVPRLKGVNVAAQEVFRRLIEEELQKQRARIRQRHHEAGQGAAGAAHHDIAEAAARGSQPAPECS